MTVGLTPDEGEGLEASALEDSALEASATGVSSLTPDAVIPGQRHLHDSSDGHLDHVPSAPYEESDTKLDHEDVVAPKGPVGPELGDTTDTRRELREARRLRRRTLWLCAGVLALCLGLTALTVDLARSRPMPGSSGATISVSAPHDHPSFHRSTLGDLSPRGGTS